MMTSNHPLEDRGKRIGDVAGVTAILDRFLHHAEVIAITGRSYRLRNRAPDEAPITEPGAAESSKPAIPSAGSTPGGKQKKQASKPAKACRS
jgi:hypothetical protein